MQRQPSGHFGLPGMRERAEIVGGRLEVWSKLNSGTQVELSIPGTIAYDGASPVRNFRGTTRGKAAVGVRHE